MTHLRAYAASIASDPRSCICTLALIAAIGVLGVVTYARFHPEVTILAKGDRLQVPR